MRQPTDREVREIDIAHAEAAVAAGEHDLFVIDLRQKYGLVGESTLPVKNLEGSDRARLSDLVADAQRKGTQARVMIEKLRLVCGASKDAELVDGKWRSPVTKKPYREDGAEGGNP